MLGMVVVARRRRRWFQRKPRLTLRELGRVVSNLQRAEAQALHAMRDGCLMCGLQASAVRRAMVAVIPTRLIRDADWRHQHVEMPGARMQARIDDSGVLK